MYKISMSFLYVLTALCTSQANANGYTYVAPTPTLGDNSLYTITEISKEKYDTSYGNSEVFYDAEVLEKDNIAYHYYKYVQKDGTTSSSSITSGNGGQDVEGGWYAKFGTFDGQAINLRSGSLGNVRGDFVNNAVDGSNGYAGAFYMEETTIKSVTGDFVNNHIGGYFGNGGGYVSNTYGGAIYIQNGAEIGHTFALTKKTSVSPNLSVRYTQINYDNAKDNVGKKYKFDDIKHMEAELNLTATKNFANGKVYVKTGVIQTLTEDDKVVITGLDKVNTYHDQTLGKVEVGGNYNITDKLSAYGWTNYTASSNYNSTSLGLGINFSW